VIDVLRKRRGVFILLAIIVAAMLVLAACGGGEENGDGGGGTTGGDNEPTAGGTYNFPLTANPVSIEPLNAQESEGIQVAHQVFEGLVKYELQDDGSMLAVPCIAESWEASDDATVFTFTLKKGVMFQPPVSREVVAQDFVDSWNRVTVPDAQSLVSYILAPVVGVDDGGYQTDVKAGVNGVKAIDDYTLEVTLRYPFAEFPQTLGHTVTAVTPVEYIEKVGEKAYFDKPVGTGQFMVESWKPNQKIELVKNPDYWDKENAAYVDRIHMPIITDTNTEWLEFKKGNLDFTSVPPGQVKVAENDPKVKSGEWVAKKWPALSIYYIGVNMTDKVLGYPAGEKGFQLRQALTYSADRNAVINIVNEGVPLEANGIVPLGIPGYVENQSPYLYDPEKAKELVAAYGDVPVLQLWYNTDLAHQKIVEALQAGWKTVGIETELSNFEWGTYLAKLGEGNQGSGDQLYRMGWIGDYPSMDNFLYLFTSEASGYLSYTFYNNKDYDKLINEARQTTDTAERESMYQEAEKILMTDAPAIPLYTYRDFRVTNNRVQNQVFNPMYFVDMWTVWVAQ
jgi:peptide/nickel transport system substrate-binding protein/oligopeptide transport system substrate-binding protein